jgi:sortase A
MAPPVPHPRAVANVVPTRVTAAAPQLTATVSLTATAFQPVTNTPTRAATALPTQTPEPTALPATATPQPTPTLPPAAPELLEIPAIGLSAPVTVVPPVSVWVGGQNLPQWSAPNQMAAGWHEGSALAGQPGNTVLNGHHNIYGSVFANLRHLSTGDLVVLWGEGRAYPYTVVQTMLLEERFASIDARHENARWILPSEDERLTLVTCWPPESNTHRLVVVAVPVQ